jgi:hypothetical protein
MRPMGTGPLAVGKKWFHTIVVVGASLTAGAGCSSSAATDAGSPDSGATADTASGSPDGGSSGPGDTATDYPSILIPYR